MTGFVNIVNSTLSVLRTNFPLHTNSVLQPLIYSIAMAYYVLDTESTEEVHLRKMASNLRQQGLKCLSSVFEFVGNAFDWSTSMEDIYAVVVKPRISHFRMKTYNNLLFTKTFPLLGTQSISVPVFVLR